MNGNFRRRFFAFFQSLRRFTKNRLNLLCLLIIVAYLIVALCVEGYSIYCAKNLILPVYERGDIEKRFQPPSSAHWFGTDYIGRDVFLRALAGTATAVKVGLLASSLAVFIGVTLGVAGGYFGGWNDDLTVWLYSIFAAMPSLLFVLAFALLVSKGFLCAPLNDAFSALCSAVNTEPGMMAVYLGIGITGWVSLCQMIRAETFKLRETGYVQSAIVSGIRRRWIIIKHILPNLFHLIIIFFSIRFAGAVMTEVIVSYLGLGVQKAPSWGVMIADGQERLWRGVWWEVGAASLFMFFLVLALNILADALRDFLDPRLNNNS
jgi:peptide/nickel transport system permease protein